MAKEYSQSELQEIMIRLLAIGDKLDRWELQFVDEELMQHEGTYTKNQEDKLIKIYEKYIRKAE